MYVDDILIISKTLSVRIEHLQMLFQRLRQYTFTINFKNSVFCESSVYFLGYAISVESLLQTLEKVKFLMKTLNKPSTIGNLRRTNRVFNFYRKFLRRAAGYLTLFNKFLERKIIKKCSY